MIISKNLPTGKNYVLLKSEDKIPITSAWQNNPIRNPSENNKNNIGMVMTEDNLGVDCDSEEMEDLALKHLPQNTFIQRSARKQGLQYIFKVKDFKENLGLELNGKPVGDILAERKQMVLSPSSYRITKEDEKLGYGKEGQLKHYEVVNDKPILEISKEEFMKFIFLFDSQITKKAEEDFKEYTKANANIDDLKITDVLSGYPTNKPIPNMWHGSTGKGNLVISPEKNLAYCFRNSCNCAINPAKALALNMGLIKTCTDAKPTGQDFLKVLKEAETKYGIKPSKKVEEDYKEEDYKEEDYNFEPLSLKELMAVREDKSNEIIMGVNKGDKILTFGDSNCFKTLSSVYRGLCLASGKKYLDEFKVRKTPVLYLSAEDRKLLNKKKVKPILRGMKIRKLDITFHTITLENCKQLDETKYRKYICKLIKKYNIGWIILDTGVLFFENYDDNKAQDVNKIYNRFLKELSLSNNVVVELITHTDKNAKNYLGSTKWKGNSDVVFRIARKDLEFKFEICNDKNRDLEIETLEIAVEVDRDKSGKNVQKTIFKLLSSKEAGVFKKRRENKSKTRSFLREKIFELISSNKSPILKNDIVSRLQAMEDCYAGKSSIYGTIKTMEEDNEIKGGVWGYKVNIEVDS